MTEKNTVSCRNVNIIAEYVKHTIGSDALLLVDLPHSPEYLKGENHWIPLSLFTEIMERAIELLKDPDAPYKMGMSAMSSGSWGAFRYLQQIFLAVIMGPVEAYKKVSEYNGHFNKTKTLSVIHPTKTSCFLKVVFKNGIDPVDDFYSESFIHGLLASVPHNWGLPDASIDDILHEYDIVYLLQKVGGLGSEDIVLEDGKLVVRGVQIGHRVKLLETDEKGQTLLTKHTDMDPYPSDDYTGIHIDQEYVVSKQLTLHFGEVYNAPYFLYRIRWRPLSFQQKIKHLVLYTFSSKQAYLKGMESSLATINNYVESLEEKVIERTHQLNEAKQEAEYWREKADGLLYTMLPQHILKQMMSGRLEPEQMVGSVMYTDLADFTAYSKSISPKKIEKELTHYFTEMCKIITANGGWVNKFLGDGILIIFGLDKKPGYVEAAARAGLEMQSIIHQYPWQTRIGIATGPFVTGEFGNETLRRFDCIGHTMNLGSRLQGLADTGQVLTCDTTYNVLRKKGYGFLPARRVFAKGIGDVEAYTLVSLPQEKNKLSEATPEPTKRAKSARPSKKRVS